MLNHVIADVVFFIYIYILYSNFKDKHLKDIDPGVLNLYLFYCFNARNEAGASWYSIEKINKVRGNYI